MWQQYNCRIVIGQIIKALQKKKNAVSNLSAQQMVLHMFDIERAFHVCLRMLLFRIQTRLKPFPQNPHLNGRVCIRKWTISSQGQLKAFLQTVQLQQCANLLLCLRSYSTALTELSCWHSWIEAFFTVHGLSLIITCGLSLIIASCGTEKQQKSVCI